MEGYEIMDELSNLKKQWEAVMSCMGCGDCGYAIRPAVGRYLTCPVKEAKGKEAFEIFFSRGKMTVMKSVLEGKLPLSKELAEFVYQCSQCGNCTEVCHQTHNENIVLNTSKWIEHVDVWDALRRDLIDSGYAPLEKHAKLIEYMNELDMKNPYAEEKAKKSQWAEGFSNIKEAGEFAIFAGCTMPLRQTETLKNMMKIFEAAGKEIAYSKDEWCCGSIAMRIGDYDSVKEEVNHNIDLFKNMGAKTVFSPCAGCFRTLKKDYPEIIGGELPFEVKHVTEVLAEMINNGEVPFKEQQREKLKVTYHDPCHLGRHMDLYDIPREVIKKIPGIELIEMRRNRNNAWCCGAGGGLKSQFPELAVDISKDRIEEAVETDAEILLTSCPFCVSNLQDALAEMDQEIQEKIRVVDIIDFIADRI
ncbi:MAG: (Fe-S)-binding protein [Promethearchaeia archaeon]